MERHGCRRFPAFCEGYQYPRNLCARCGVAVDSLAIAIGSEGVSESLSGGTEPEFALKADPDIPYPEGSQSAIREVAMSGLKAAGVEVLLGALSMLLRTSQFQVALHRQEPYPRTG
jgi:hypothetical protein